MCVGIFLVVPPGGVRLRDVGGVLLNDVVEEDVGLVSTLVGV